LRLDAAIAAPFPMLETLSNIFNGNAVKGRQQFSLNLCVSKMSAFWLKTKWRLCPPSPHSPNHTPCNFFLFPWMKQDLKGRQYADIAGIQQESLVALDSISVEDFRQYFQHWEWCWDCCIQLQGEYLKVTEVSNLYKYFK
jgi:hypothetical protein